jgi:hypothetical protein
MSQPADADAFANPRRQCFVTRLIDRADDLVAWDDGPLRIGQLSVDDVQVGPAYRAGFDADTYLPWAGNRIGPLLKNQGFTGSMKNHSSHGLSFLQA